MTPQQLEKLFAYIDARIDERAIVHCREDLEWRREALRQASQELRDDLMLDIRWVDED
jgi:hypothetical protein